VNDPTFSGALADIGGRVVRCAYHGTPIVDRRCGECDSPELVRVCTVRPGDVVRLGFGLGVRTVVESLSGDGVGGRGWEYPSHVWLLRYAGGGGNSFHRDDEVERLLEVGLCPECERSDDCRCEVGVMVR
jgi:hypothetical protein